MSMIHRHKVENRAKGISDAPREPKKEEKGYTKTDINRMTKSELVEFANNLGIADAENSSGAELKQAIIENLNL